MSKIVSMSTKSTVTIATVGLLSAGLYGCSHDHKDTKLSSCKAVKSTCAQNTTMFEQFFNYSLYVENKEANATKSKAVHARCAQAGGVWMRQFEAARTNLTLTDLQDFQAMKETLLIMKTTNPTPLLEVTFIKFHDGDGARDWLFQRVPGTVSLVDGNKVELQYRWKVSAAEAKSLQSRDKNNLVVLDEELIVKEVISHKLKEFVQVGDKLMKVKVDGATMTMKQFYAKVEVEKETFIHKDVELIFRIKDYYSTKDQAWFELGTGVEVTKDNWAKYQVVSKIDADSCHAAGGMITSDYNKEKPSIKCMTLKNWLDINHRADSINSEERCTLVNDQVLPQFYPQGDMPLNKKGDDLVVKWVDGRCVLVKPCEAIWEEVDSPKCHKPVHPQYPYCKAKPISKDTKDAWKNVQCMEISRLDDACVVDQKRGVCGYYGVQTALELNIGKGMCQFTNSTGACAPAAKADDKKDDDKKAGDKKAGDKKGDDKKDGDKDKKGKVGTH